MDLYKSQLTVDSQAVVEEVISAYFKTTWEFNLLPLFG
jgi:hypothetical protein